MQNTHHNLKTSKQFKLPSYATCLSASIRPKTFQQLKFYLELSVKDKKVADVAYQTLSKQQGANGGPGKRTAHSESRNSEGSHSMPRAYSQQLKSRTTLLKPYYHRPLPPNSKEPIQNKDSFIMRLHEAKQRHSDNEFLEGLETNMIR